MTLLIYSFKILGQFENKIIALSRDHHGAAAQRLIKNVMDLGSIPTGEKNYLHSFALVSRLSADKTKSNDEFCHLTCDVSNVGLYY